MVKFVFTYPANFWVDRLLLQKPVVPPPFKLSMQFHNHVDNSAPLVHILRPVTSSQPISFRFILILSFRQGLRLPSGRVPFRFHVNSQHVPLVPPFLSHSPPFDCHTIFGEQYKLRSSSLCSFSPSLLSLPPHIVAHIFLSTPFSNTQNLCFSFNVRDQVSGAHKVRGKRYSCVYCVSFVEVRCTFIFCLEFQLLFYSFA
jgi:hypothetical protein